jgi:hypothetical protein
LILGPADDWVQLTVCLKDVVGQLHVMHDEHQEAFVELSALRSSATLWDLVLKGYDEMSSLSALISSAADLIEGRVDAATVNGVHWRARLALTAALSHFPKLEPEMGLLRSGRNADLAEG